MYQYSTQSDQKRIIYVDIISQHYSTNCLNLLYVIRHEFFQFSTSMSYEYLARKMKICCHIIQETTLIDRPVLRYQYYFFLSQTICFFQKAAFAVSAWVKHIEAFSAFLHSLCMEAEKAKIRRRKRCLVIPSYWGKPSVIGSYISCCRKL